MRSRVRYGIAGCFGRLPREMSIRFFGYFVGRQYLSLPVPRIERSKYLPGSFPSAPVPLPPSAASPPPPTFRPCLLTRASAPVVFLTLLFGVSTSFASSFFSTPFRPPSLCSFASFSSWLRSFQTLLHSREIAFKLFGFLARRGFIVRNPCCIAQRVPVDLREVASVTSPRESAA